MSDQSQMPHSEAQQAQHRLGLCLIVQGAAAPLAAEQPCDGRPATGSTSPGGLSGCRDAPMLDMPLASVLKLAPSML